MAILCNQRQQIDLNKNAGLAYTQPTLQHCSLQLTKGVMSYKWLHEMYVQKQGEQHNNTESRKTIQDRINGCLLNGTFVFAFENMLQMCTCS